MKYTLTTTPFADGRIEQALKSDVSPFPSVVDQFTKWVVDTREAGVRDALIQLGWTPPVEKAHKYDAFGPWVAMNIDHDGLHIIRTFCGDFDTEAECLGWCQKTNPPFNYMPVPKSMVHLQ